MQAARSVLAKDLDLHIERTVAPRQQPTAALGGPALAIRSPVITPAPPSSRTLPHFQPCIDAGRGVNWAAVGRPVRPPAGAYISSC
jgi:hypothetical protein